MRAESVCIHAQVSYVWIWAETASRNRSTRHFFHPSLRCCAVVALSSARCRFVVSVTLPSASVVIELEFTADGGQRYSSATTWVVTVDVDRITYYMVVYYHRLEMLASQSSMYEHVIDERAPPISRTTHVEVWLYTVSDSNDITLNAYKQPTRRRCGNAMDVVIHLHSQKSCKELPLSNLWENKRSGSATLINGRANTTTLEMHS